MGYAEVYQGWKDDPEAFWMQAAEAIDWDTAPTRALDDSNAPLYEWLTDARVNTCWNAIDRHVAAGRGAQVAIIHDSPVTGTVQRLRNGPRAPHRVDECPRCGRTLRRLITRSTADSHRGRR